MSDERWLARSRRWLRLLLLLYPAAFRARMGEALVEEYMQRCRAALQDGGVSELLRTWARAFGDAARNGPAERIRPGGAWPDVAAPGRREASDWVRDGTLVVRRVARAPLFAGSMVGTLSVGLGAFAVVFALVHNVLLAPMPYDDPDELYYVWRDYRAFFDLDRGWLGGTDVAALAEEGDVIVDAAAIQRGLAVLSGEESADPVEIAVMWTTPNLFSLLGVEPTLGRGFAPDEGGPGRPQLMVLTHELWTRVGADPGIVGTELRLGGEPYTVIGVMPRDFAFVRNSSLGAPQGADAYVTLEENMAETEPGEGSYAGLVRVRPGASFESVEEAVAAVGAMVDERDFQSEGLRLYPVGMKEDLVARVRPALILLGAAGLLLILVLMLNVGALLLTRAAQREQEFAVSRALGAKPSVLVRTTLLEGAFLGLAGGVAGTILGVWGTRALVGLMPLDLPRRASIDVDGSTAAVVIAAGLLIGLLASTAPAAWAASAPLASLLGSASVRGGGGHGRMRRGMVVTQVALSLVLLTSGGLVGRSFERLLRADPGFDAEGVLTLRVPVSSALYPEAADAAGIRARIRAELSSLPGVSGVGAAVALPLSASASQTTVRIPGAPGNTGDADHDGPLVDYTAIDPGYVETMGMRFLAGRGFPEARPEGVREALIDDRLAAHFFPSSNPLGATIPFQEDSLRVVGVVRQARLYDVHEDGRPQLYIRAEDWGYFTLRFAVRSERAPESLIPEARATIRRVDPRLAVSEVRTMEEVVADSLRQQRVTAVLIAGFSLGALLLAAMGLYGVVASTVTRRRHEVAVRLALGADHRQVLRLILADGARLILVGLVVGLPVTYFAGRALRGLLVGISPSDPATLAMVAAGLGVVAIIACYLPARRVLRIEPARSLRDE